MDDCTQKAPVYETVGKVELQPSPAAVGMVAEVNVTPAPALHEIPVELRGSPPLDLPLLNSSLLI
jgi:hypothetical protein